MHSLIIAIGTNLGDKIKNLEEAKNKINEVLIYISESRVYSSKAILYFDQPDFFNQVLEYKIPNNFTPTQLMAKLLEVENSLGRTRDIEKGPRLIDIDIIFWGSLRVNETNLVIPHYDWHNRSFVVRPLQDLSCFKSIEKCFKIPREFNEEAHPIT